MIQIDVQTLRNIKRMCRTRYTTVEPWKGMCDGCLFEREKESKKGNTCQLTMLLGNMTTAPCDWDMNKIEEIINE